MFSFSDAGPSRSRHTHGGRRPKSCRGRNRAGWDANFAHNHERNCSASGDEPQTDFQPYRSRGSVQLRRSGTNIALNGDFTFCALNDSNDLDVVKRPQRTTCTRVWLRISFQSHLNGQVLEESKGHSKERLSSRSSRPSRASAIPDTLHSLSGLIGRCELVLV